MSDLEDSTVTYTEVSSPFEDLSDIGSPGVIVYGYDGLPIMPEDPYVEAALQPPPSPDYLPGPKELQAPPPPDFVLEPVYPEFMPPEDDSDPDEDLEEDPTDYPTDRDDDDEEEEEESSRDETDKEENEDEDEEQEENPAPADSIPPPPLAYRVTARMSIRPQMPVLFLSEEVAERFLAMPTPPPSPLTLLSLPLPQI
ncbi:hypothetical protein Tco_1469881, partial [Tanacetum coccineum]